MKKLLTLVSAFALVFTSCSSDDSPSTPSTVGTKLTQIIETYGDGSVETATITYTLIQNGLTIALTSRIKLHNQSDRR